MEPLPDSEKWSGLKTRVVSALALVALAAVFLCLGGVAFSAFVIFAAITMMQEWESLTHDSMLLLRYIGYVYVILPCACLIWLRSLKIPEDAGFGFTLTLALIAMISATDIGAYFVGRRMGKRKLAPTISPNKTWEGLLGGMGAAVMTGIAFSPYLHVVHSLLLTIFSGVLVSVLAQSGDVFESWIKRQAGVKDSGTILPGHGGLLDRFDGYMFATPVLALIVHLSLSK